MRLYFSAFFLFIFSFHIPGQTPLIDRLKKDITTATSQDKKLQALFALCEEKQSLNTDTFCKYASVAKEISLQQKKMSNIAMAEYYLAGCLVKRGSLDTALQICEQYIPKVKNDRDAVTALMKLTALKAQIFIRSNRFKEGLAEIYKVLHTAEENKDTMMQMVGLNGIGWLNMEMDQGPEALKWFFKALKVTDNKYYHEKNSNIYSNIAAIYKELHKNDSAEFFIKKAIIFSRKIQNLFFLANSLAILADIYIDAKTPALAEAPLNEALEIRKEIGDPFYIVSDISQLAIYYANVSQPAKGIAMSQQGIEIANKFHITAKLSYLYHALGENYKAAGNYVQYSKTLQQVMDMKDSMYAANSAEAKAEMDTRYGLDKKENLIRVQKLELTNKNNLFYGSLILLFLTLLTSWLLFRGYKKNQQIKLLKMQTEEKQLAAHAVISAEEKERKRISRDLHDNIGAYTTVLMANTEQLRSHAAGNSIQQSVKNVYDNAQNIMGSLQETIWVLNNDVITITDFIDRFKVYSKKILQNFPEIQIRFKEQLERDIILSPAEALHLFRIMQEGLQNTIKHAQPHNIIVTVESKEAIIISIKDDGKGFNIENIVNGNGLSNMRHRAIEAGYRLNISSNENGTELTLQKNHAFAV
jgi:signal transduction histidine kinase